MANTQIIASPEATRIEKELKQETGNFVRMTCKRLLAGRLEILHKGLLRDLSEYNRHPVFEDGTGIEK